MGFCSRLAAAKVARVQAAVAYSVLLTQPGEETLETETVAAVGGGAVPISKLANKFHRHVTRAGCTYFLWSVYQ